MAVTIHDVARVADVSISTVSRALASPGVVAEPTLERVLDAAEQLGYRPNPRARSLITGRTSCLGLVLPDLENPFFASICKGVQAAARERGHTVFVADTDEDVKIEAAVIRDMRTQVDGLVLCSCRGSDAAIKKLIEGKPTIVQNRRIAGLPSMVFDDAATITDLVDHLVSLGHRRIGYAGGPRTSRSQRRRLKAFQGLEAERPGTRLISVGEFRPYVSGGHLAADAAREQDVTAVLAFNDVMALGIIDRLSEQGISVPGQMSVTGIDDVEMAGLARPRLTTVHLPRVEMGQLGVGWLLDMVLGTDTHPGSTRRIKGHLMTRGSTGQRAPR